MRKCFILSDEFNLEIQYFYLVFRFKYDFSLTTMFSRNSFMNLITFEV